MIGGFFITLLDPSAAVLPVAVEAGSLLSLSGTDLVGVSSQAVSQEYIPTLGFLAGKLYGGTGINGLLLRPSVGTISVTSVGVLNGSSVDSDSVFIDGQSKTKALAVMDDLLFGGMATSGELVQRAGAITTGSLATASGGTITAVASAINSQYKILALAEMSSVVYGATGSGGRLLQYS